MNVLQTRLANTAHVLSQNRSGSRNPIQDFSIGEELVVKQDVDVQVDEGILSVPAGTPARITNVESTMISLDLGTKLGGFEMTRDHVEKYFHRGTHESSPAATKPSDLVEANLLAVTPGRRVRVTGYDPTVGPNRGPNSPGHGGYQTLVGQMGEIVTVFGVINGVKTYKVNLVSGGQFVLGETEFEVLAESVKPNFAALRAHGLV